MQATPSPNPRKSRALDAVARVQNLMQSRDDRGAAMAEYGLLLAFVALVVMGVALTLGSSIKGVFGFANETFDNAPTFAPNPTN